MCGHFPVLKENQEMAAVSFFRILVAVVIYSWIITEESKKKTGNETLERKQYMEPLPKDLVNPFAVHHHACPSLPRIIKDQNILTVIELPTQITSNTAKTPASEEKKPMPQCVVCHSKV